MHVIRLTSYLLAKGNSSSTTAAIRASNGFWKIATALSPPPLFPGLMLSMINGRPTVDTWYRLFLYC